MDLHHSLESGKLFRHGGLLAEQMVHQEDDRYSEHSIRENQYLDGHPRISISWGEFGEHKDLYEMENCA